MAVFKISFDDQEVFPLFISEIVIIIVWLSSWLTNCQFIGGVSFSIEPSLCWANIISTKTKLDVGEFRLNIFQESWVAVDKLLLLSREIFFFDRFTCLRLISPLVLNGSVFLQVLGVLYENYFVNIW